MSSSVLGENSSKWMGVILSFIDDPSKYGLPRLIFDLPNYNDQNVEDYLNYARQQWRKINPRSVNPYENLKDIVPYWMVFTLPRRAAMLYLAVWDEYWERTDLDRYQDIQYNLQELIQNFIREELLLFKLVRPFRRRTGQSVLNTVIDPTKLSDGTISILSKYTSPQKVLHEIAEFVKGRTIQSGIAYILMIEKFSKIIAKTNSATNLHSVTAKFSQDLERLRNVDFRQKIPRRGKLAIKPSSRVEIKQTETIIEFDKIELQEYDGYVEIAGYSDVENRNFRIYNCKEEDDLREEIWKERHYPLRNLVEEVLEERYSRPSKKYKLRYGVEIVILPPNWVNRGV